MPVAVIGAGITGLTTALRLIEEGVSVTLFDGRSAEGGLGATFRSDGHAFDFGPHEFTTRNADLIHILEDVCGDDLITVEKRIAQFFRGRYLAYPFRTLDVLRNVGPGLATRAGLEVGAVRLRSLFRREPCRSFEEWTKSRFGRTLYDSYFGPYTRKVWGVSPDRLDSLTAEQRITVGSLWGLVRRSIAFQLFRREDHKHPHSEYRRSFRYFKGGVGRLQAALRDAVETRGGELQFDKRLVGLDRDADGHAETLRFTDGTTTTPREFSHVVSTIPLPAIVEAGLGEHGRALLESHPLHYRGMAFVFLKIKKPRLGPYHWVYYPDSDIPFQRLTEFVHFDPAMAPESHTSVLLEVACDPGEEAWESPDDDLVRRCVDVLSDRLGLMTRDDVVGVDVIRVRHAYPLQLRGHAAAAATLLAELENVPNLVSIGRQGMFRYCNMDECMEMAIEIAPRVAAGERRIRCETPAGWKGVAIESSESPTSEPTSSPV